MSSPRDYLSDLRRYYLPKARTHISDAWYRTAGQRIQGARGRFSNWRNQRTLDRGKRDIPARAGDRVRSSLPVYRNRVNKATGRPHRDDRDMGRLSDQSPARMRAKRQPGAERNQKQVRDLLASRQPQYARELDRTVRDLSPRRGRTR